MTHARAEGIFARLAMRLGRPGAGRALRRMLRGVPGNCPLCSDRTRGGVLCPQCCARIVESMRAGAPRCPRCAVRLAGASPCPDCIVERSAVSRVVAAFDYDSPGGLLVRQFKHGKRFLLAPALADLMAQAIRRDALPLPAGTVLVPVPSRKASIIERGFNPAAELARHLAGEFHLPCRPDWLVRMREDARQTGRTRRQRMAGAPHLYRCPAIPANACIALVDDVMTTGSTLHHAAAALRGAGAGAVLALVLARTPMR